MANSDEMIERLPFGEQEPHQAAEAAIHLSRYSIVRPFCGGARVLDIACGEGYGSFLMATRWGASSVVGVDVSEEAVLSARRSFDADNLTFVLSDGESLPEQFAENTFDVAICLETIEHVQDPAMLLGVLRRLVKPEGCIIVSCPNDHWYYPDANEGNPFHVRKFTETEFFEMAESVLGPPAHWLRGTAVAGYANVPDDVVPADNRVSGVTQDLRHENPTLVPPDQAITAETCSYFLGVWGPASETWEPIISGAVFPVPMSSSDVGVWRGCQSAVTSARETVLATEGLLDEFRLAMNRQTAMIDERDAYIRELEALVIALQTELARTSISGMALQRVRRMFARSRKS